MALDLRLSGLRLHLLLPLSLLLFNRLSWIVLLPFLKLLFLDLFNLPLIAGLVRFIVLLFVLFACHVLSIALYRLVSEVVSALCLDRPIVANARGVSYLTVVLHHLRRLPRVFELLSNCCFRFLFVSASFCIVPHLSNPFRLGYILLLRVYLLRNISID